MIYKANILLILNFLFSPVIIILFVVSKNYEIASYFGLISAFVIFISQSLSSNKRQIIILSNNVNLLKKTISFRILFSLIIIIILIIFLFFINKNKQSILLFLLSTCLCLFWIKEIIITEYELKKKNKIIFFETFLYISFYLSIIFVIFFKRDIYDLEKILSFYIFVFLLIFSQNLIKNTKNNLFKKNNLSIKFDRSYLSSFSMIFCNLLWRICIFLFTDELNAGLFYAAFSLGSLPSTLFVNTLGPHLVKLKNSDKFMYSFLVIYSVLISIIVFLLNKYLIINSQKIFIEILSFSLIGSILMLLGQYKRHITLLNFLRKKDKIFLNDAVYSTLLFTLIPIIYFIGGESFLRTGFFLGSILCLIYYYSLDIYLSNYDKQNI